MDLISRYRQFADSIDGCQDEQQLKQYQNSSAINTMVREYWKQRQLVTGASTPLERQQALVKLQWLHHFFGCNIAVKRNIKKFTAPNGLFGIFIAPETAVDENCVIFQQVYIGGDTLADSARGGFPVVGKNVHIGAGAKIVGSAVIGDNARIDPNCFVNFDVPANSHVVNTGSHTVIKPSPQDNSHITAQQYLTKLLDVPAVDCTETDTLSVHKAQQTDLEDIIGLYKERINWFKWKKIPQWTFYLVHHPREEFARRISEGCYYIVKDKGNTVAGFVVSADSENWQDDHSNACYLSRAISKTNYKKMGSYIAQQAKAIAQQEGRDFVRLECVFGNSGLNEIWHSLGFEYMGDAHGDYHCALRQMDLRPEDEREPADPIPDPTIKTKPVQEETQTEENTSAEAETAPAEAENTPAEAETAPAEAENTPAAAEEPPTEITE